MGGERETRDGEVTRKRRALCCAPVRRAHCSVSLAGRVRRPGGRAGPGARDSGNPDRSPRASLLTLILTSPRAARPPPRGRAVGIKISFLCLGWRLGAVERAVPGPAPTTPRTVRRLQEIWRAGLLVSVALAPRIVPVKLKIALFFTEFRSSKSGGGLVEG